MPQLGVCTVTIEHKNVDLPYCFFTVPGNGPAFLAMTECERLKLLSVKCTPIDASQRKGQITEQSTR